MPHVRWYFDFISPFAWLQWQALAAHRHRFTLEAVPIVFGAVLHHLGQRGPAEIPLKREFTYRMVQWQAAQSGTPLRFPPAHPFNPLAALRFCTAAQASHEVVDAVFRLIWEQGQLPDSSGLVTVAQTLDRAELLTQIDADATRAALRAATDQAIARGVYGVPTLDYAGELYWGNDATGMFLHALEHPACWEEAPYDRLRQLPAAAQRRPS